MCKYKHFDYSMSMAFRVLKFKIYLFQNTNHAFLSFRVLSPSLIKNTYISEFSPQFSLLFLDSQLTSKRWAEPIAQLTSHTPPLPSL